MYQINESIKFSFNGQDEWRILSSKKDIYPKEKSDLYHSLSVEAYTSKETYELEEKLHKNEKIPEGKITVYYGEVLVYEIIFKNLEILRITEEISEGSMPITKISFLFDSNETKVYKDLGNIVKSEF